MACSLIPHTRGDPSAPVHKPSCASSAMGDAGLPGPRRLDAMGSSNVSREGKVTLKGERSPQHAACFLVSVSGLTRRFLVKWPARISSRRLPTHTFVGSMTRQVTLTTFLSESLNPPQSCPPRTELVTVRWERRSCLRMEVLRKQKRVLNELQAHQVVRTPCLAARPAGSVLPSTMVPWTQRESSFGTIIPPTEMCYTSLML